MKSDDPDKIIAAQATPETPEAKGAKQKERNATQAKNLSYEALGEEGLFLFD
jgi:hypothetical protein